MKLSTASTAAVLAILGTAPPSIADGTTAATDSPAAAIPVAAAPPTAATAPAPAPSPSTPAAATPGSPTSAAAVPELTRSEAARLIGVNFGQQLQRLGITDPEALDTLSRGMKEGLAGTKATAEEQQRLAHFFYASTKAAISSNINNAHAFLLRNGGEKDVHTTSSGLQYSVIAAGNPAARSPTLADQVTVHYRGTLLDGTEFDGSDVPGAPTTFLVGGVIKGWQEALLMMKPGSKWRMFVPPELAYGNKARRNIPGGSLLIFDVELTGVTAAATTPAPPESR